MNRNATDEEQAIWREMLNQSGCRARLHPFCCVPRHKSLRTVYTALADECGVFTSIDSQQQRAGNSLAVR
jgi:hypothetical protein